MAGVSLRRTLIVWWRYGHEHGEDDGLRTNGPTVIDAHIRGKVEGFRQTHPSDWRWFEASCGLLVERSAQDEIMYYLPSKDWLIMQRDNRRRGDSWRWYIHIGDTEWSSRYDAWVFKDHFVDVVVGEDCRTHSILDLDDLAHAHEIGLVSNGLVDRILRSSQALVNLIRCGRFPPDEVREISDIARAGMVASGSSGTEI